MARLSSVLTIAVVAAAVLAVAQAEPVVQWQDVGEWPFERFVAAFRRPYVSGTPEYAMRQGIYEIRRTEIVAHNKDTTKTWKRTVNRFADQTEEERARVRGGGLYYGPRLPGRRDHVPPTYDAKDIPAAVDWRDKNVITNIKDQGQCGSCWAHAATETMESYVAIASGQLPVLSQQQVASCTKDPQQCGGTGGCEGATNELGMQSVVDLGGIAEEWTYPYQSYWGKDYVCRYNDTAAGPSGTPAVASITGYVRLPANNYTAVIESLALIGPLAITVDAAAWFDYSYGVYDGCGTDSVTLDHGVQLVGYGVDAEHGPYWTVRNSWGTGFGEEGYIRIKRYADNVPCGVDTHPKDGTGCKNGPPTQTVCGACGILSDVSYAVGAKPATPSPPF